MVTEWPTYGDHRHRIDGQWRTSDPGDGPCSCRRRQADSPQEPGAYVRSHTGTSARKCDIGSFSLRSYVSPRHRAQRTFELLGLGCKGPLPWQQGSASSSDAPSRSTEATVEVTDAVREWDYGDYEGLTSATIAKQREEAGLGPWEIWRDGCPGGE